MTAHGSPVKQASFGRNLALPFFDCFLPQFPHLENSALLGRLEIMCVNCLVHSGSSVSGSRDWQQERQWGRLLLDLHLSPPLKHWEPQLGAPTYISDYVSIEFGDGLDAFDSCHQFILIFHLNHCLQGTEEMAYEKVFEQGARCLLIRLVPLCGSLLTRTKALISIQGQAPSSLALNRSEMYLRTEENIRASSVRILIYGTWSRNQHNTAKWLKCKHSSKLE